MIKKNVDYKLFFTVLIMIIFGMIMISSVSVYSSFRVTDLMVKKGLITEAYNHFYVLRNMIHVFIAFLVLSFIVKIHYSIFEKYAKHIFIGVLMLLVIVLVLGMSLKGARGWLNIPGIPFTIQPTEFLKLSLILYLATFLKKYKATLKSFEHGFIPFITILGFVLILVALQPDFGTIMVMAPVAIIMFFYAGANMKHLLILFVMGIFLSLSVYFAGSYDKVTGKNLNSLGYIRQRIDNFLDDNKEAIKKKTINYQTEQAIIAIGSGGFAGLGFGQSIQKFGYLPEVQGDFIFSVIIEELGFVGGCILLGFYLFIGYRGFCIASQSNDPFAEYTAVGISSRILLQAFINIGVNLNVVPLTGITLPFISYGGSSILGLILALGILLNISRYVEEKKQFMRFSKVKSIF